MWFIASFDIFQISSIPPRLIHQWKFVFNGPLGPDAYDSILQQSVWQLNHKQHIMIIIEKGWAYKRGDRSHIFCFKVYVGCNSEKVTFKQPVHFPSELPCWTALKTFPRAAVEKKNHSSHMKLRLITELIFFLLRAHVRLLYISTLKHQNSKSKPTDLSRGGQRRSKWEFLPFWKR